MPRLDLIDAPTWDGTPLPGGLVVRLLSALVLAGPRGASTSTLLGALWDAPPGHPENALQAVVSRARRACGGACVVRTDHGYALDLPRREVDAWQLADLARTACDALADDDISTLVRLVEDVRIDLVRIAGASHPRAEATPEAGDPLVQVREHARRDAGRLAQALGTALSETGEHSRALELLGVCLPTLEAAKDERALAAYLRSVAATTSATSALEGYERVRARLAEEFGVDPGPRLQAVQAELLRADRPVRTGLVAQSTTILGRTAELAHIRERLASARVVTLVGPGGIGKTTLAEEVARTATQSVVHVVTLAALADDDAVAGAVARAVGARATTAERFSQRTGDNDVTAALAQHLMTVPTLLVLDNCEQILDGVARLVGTLVASCPHLTVLTTSRHALALGAEHVVPIPPLSAEVGAAMFRARVMAVRPKAAVPDGAVGRIVRVLDGLPLALELAAAQVRWLSVGEVADALDAAVNARFELLQTGARDVPDRHRTLLAVLAWSWDLLEEPERRALTWLAAFRSPFGTAGAAAVLHSAWSNSERQDPGHFPPSPIRLLASLVDHSLLIVEESGSGVRYRMLETIREFALLQLASRGGPKEYEAAWAGVRSWVVSLVDGLREDLCGPRELDALSLVDPEMPEVVEVLRDAERARDLSTVLALAPVLQSWTERREHSAFEAAQGAGELIADAVAEGTLTRAHGLGSPPGGLEGEGGESVQALAREVQVDAALACLAQAILLGAFLHGAPSPRMVTALHALGPGTAPEIAAKVSVASLPLTPSGEPERAALERLARGTRRASGPPVPEPPTGAPAVGEADARAAATSSTAWMWLAMLRENEGDIEGAIEAANRSIEQSRPDAPPSRRLLMRSMLAQLLMSAGRVTEGAAVARATLAELNGRSRAVERELTVLLAVADYTLGDLEGARHHLAAGEADVGDPGWPWSMLLDAEIRLAAGEVADGLRCYREAVDAVEGATRAEPSSLDGDAQIAVPHVSPWTLSMLAGCVAAHARALGPAAADVVGGFAERLRTDALQALSSVRVDYPLTGLALEALAAWRIRVRLEADAQSAELVVVGERFGQSLFQGWGVSDLRETLERRAPGLSEAVHAGLGDQRGPQLKQRAAELVREVTATRDSEGQQDLPHRTARTQGRS